MRIRQAVAEDRPRVLHLAMQFHGGTPYGELVKLDAERMEVLFGLALNQGVVFIAEGADGPIGFIALVRMEHEMSGELYADEVGWWVEPEYRSGTVGPRLLAHGELWAFDNECAFIKMVAPAGSTVGRFYQKSGYTEIETAHIKRFTR